MASSKAPKAPKAPKVKKTRNFNLRNTKVAGALALILITLAFLGSNLFMQNIYQTEPYYVLNTTVPTRTLITSDMLTPVITSKDTGPKSAKTLADVQEGNLYTKFPLNQGDIVTDSNAGKYEDISTGVPDTWVVTSFPVSADNAVQGRIKRGTYFDMMIAGKEGSYYPFVNMLALDTSTSLSNASSAAAVDTQEAKQGQTEQYTVGVSPQDAAKLQNIVKNNSGDIRLVLSPRQNEYAKPKLSDYAGLFTFTPGTDLTKNLGEGADSTFSAVKRDAYGKPIQDKTAGSCSQGNARLTAEECAAANK